MAQSPDVIRSRLSVVLRVDPEQVTFKRDEATGAERVELLLRDAQIDWALQDNGRIIRRAAMDLGIDIEVGAAEPGGALDRRGT